MDDAEIEWHEKMDVILDSKGEKPNALYAMKRWLENTGHCVSDVYLANDNFAAIRVIPTNA